MTKNFTVRHLENNPDGKLEKLAVTIPQSFYGDSTFDLEKLEWWVNDLRIKLQQDLKVLFAIDPEKVVSGVVPDQDYYMVWNPYSDWTLGQLEIIKKSGKVEYGLGRSLGYRRHEEQAHLPPSAEIIVDRLRELDGEILRLDLICSGALSLETMSSDIDYV